MLPFKTDDKTFRSFLDKLDLEELQGHMRECILEDRLLEVLMELEDEYENYISNVTGIDPDSYREDAEPEELKPYVEELLNELEEDDIRWLASNVFCDFIIIELLMESDADFRWDIMQSSLDWEKSLNWELIGTKGIWLN